MRKVYVLGATGFVGSHLVNFLKEKGTYQLISVGRASCDLIVDLGYGTNALVESVSKEDYVIFLASISSPDFCRDNESDAYRVNVKGTIGLLKQLEDKGVRTVFASSDAVYGGSAKINDDNSKRSPFGSYGSMKDEVEAFIFNSCPNTKIARFSYVFNKNDKFTQSLVKSSRNQVCMSIFDGFERSIVTLDDVLDGIYNMISIWDPVKFKAVNFCGPEVLSRYDLANTIQREYLPSLRLSLENAPESFWQSRPKSIQVQSTLFPQLLGRKQQSIAESIKSWS